MMVIMIATTQPGGIMKLIIRHIITMTIMSLLESSQMVHLNGKYI